MFSPPFNKGEILRIIYLVSRRAKLKDFRSKMERAEMLLRGRGDLFLINDAPCEEKI